MHGKATLSVGVVIIKDAKVLLVKHREEALHMTGSYGLPAGKVKPNEDIKKACIKKTREETGLVLKESNLKRLPTTYYAEIEQKDGKKFFVMIPFCTTIFTGDLTATEATLPKWVELENLNKLHNLLPNVQEIIEEVVSYLK